MAFKNRLVNMHPATLVLTSFLLVIAVGTVMLELPISITSPLLWVDALFTAASAVCVTGLAPVDTGTRFTLFGQWVILGLIQVGGLGLMTISVALFRWIGRSVSIRYRLTMQDTFAHTPREDIFGLVKSTILFTLGAELVGAALLTVHWSRELPLLRAMYLGIFHSVSAFCNAGFSVFPNNLMSYSGGILLNVVVCGLIVVGGIGFPVLYDVQCWFKNRRQKKRCRLSIQSKTVLLTSGILIMGGALLFGLLERRFLLESESWSHRILVPLFQSVTCRTAGFNTVDIASLKEATLAVMIFLMFFGASPGSCGGGVKTTTLALLIVFTISRMRRQRIVNMFQKSIPNETVARSVALVLISICLISLVVFMLLIGDASTGGDVSGHRISFLGYLFETVSAFGTVGLSMNVTPLLSAWAKCWIVVMMIIGRVGVLTFSYIIAGAGPARGIEHSEENIMIG